MADDRATRAAQAAMKNPVPKSTREAIADKLARNRLDFGIATTEGTVEQVLAILALEGFVVVDVDALANERGTA